VSSKIRSIERAAKSATNGAQAVDNIEELYAAARQAKADKCLAEINEVLTRHGFVAQAGLQVGQQVVALSNVGGLPVVVQIVPK
jgi:hypothetical protein